MEKIIKYKNTNSPFYRELRKRVNKYFKDNEISKHAYFNMVLKSLFMISLYFIPFFLIITSIQTTWAIILMWVFMGFGMSGIGLSIMHDANHEAYSKHSYVNKILGKMICLIGGSDLNWRIQHNVLHHTYTNVEGMDEDIDSGILFRLSPNQKLMWGHRFQHLYAYFLYGFMTIMWITTKDYVQYARYKKRGLLKTQRTHNKYSLIKLLGIKKVYLLITLFLPITFSSLPWWGTLLCFFMMHFIAGLTLALIFQPAHVIPTSTFETPDLEGEINGCWASNQMRNTANFAPKARLFSWFVGGLNFQIEHHLFPNICHVHYRKISKIIKEVALEYNLPYYTHKSFYSALIEHARMLYNLGTKKDAPALH